MMLEDKHKLVNSNYMDYQSFEGMKIHYDLPIQKILVKMGIFPK